MPESAADGATGDPNPALGRVHAGRPARDRPHRALTQPRSSAGRAGERGRRPNRAPRARATDFKFSQVPTGPGVTRRRSLRAGDARRRACRREPLGARSTALHAARPRSSSQPRPTPTSNPRPTPSNLTRARLPPCAARRDRHPRRPPVEALGRAAGASRARRARQSRVIARVLEPGAAGRAAGRPLLEEPMLTSRASACRPPAIEWRGAGTTQVGSRPEPRVARRPNPAPPPDAALRALAASRARTAPSLRAPLLLYPQ